MPLYLFSDFSLENQLQVCGNAVKPEARCEYTVAGGEPIDGMNKSNRRLCHAINECWYHAGTEHLQEVRSSRDGLWWLRAVLGPGWRWNRQAASRYCTGI